MNPTAKLSLPATVSVAALLLLGILGGSMIVAYSGFETSPRRGGTSTVVPVPEAYILAAALYLMSFLAMLALLRDCKPSIAVTTAALCGYPAVAGIMVRFLAPN